MNLYRFEENPPSIFSFLQGPGFLRKEASLNINGLRSKRQRVVLESFRDFPLWSRLLTSLDNKPTLSLEGRIGRLVAASYEIQFSSVAQSCLTLCDPMNRSTPGLAVHHQLPEFTQTHVHWVGDAIQPSHPLSSPSVLALNPSQHQGLFQWVSSSRCF